MSTGIGSRGPSSFGQLQKIQCSWKIGPQRGCGGAEFYRSTYGSGSEEPRGGLFNGLGGTCHKQAVV